MTDVSAVINWFGCYNVKVSPTDTIGDLKQRVCKFLQIDPSLVTSIEYNNNTMTPAGDNDLADTTPNPSFTIGAVRVNLNTGGFVYQSLNGLTYVGELKDAIAGRIGNTGRPRLFFGPTELLDDNEDLSTIPIQNDSYLTVIPEERPESNKKLFIVLDHSASFTNHNTGIISKSPGKSLGSFGTLEGASVMLRERGYDCKPDNLFFDHSTNSYYVGNANHIRIYSN